VWCGTRTFLGAVTMSGWTAGVFMCCCIVALFLLRHGNLLSFTLSLTNVTANYAPGISSQIHLYPRILYSSKIEKWHSCSVTRSGKSRALSSRASQSVARARRSSSRLGSSSLPESRLVTSGSKCGRACGHSVDMRCQGSTGYRFY